MPVKHNTSAGGLKDQFLGEVIKHVTELINHHWPGIIAILEEEEIQKVKTTFGATLDCSESAPMIDTVISYSKVVKDKRHTTLEDPNQTALPFPAGETETANAADGPALEEQEGEGPVEAHKRRRKA